MLNPLINKTVFEMALMNPNPKSAKLKNGPVYKVEFEVEKTVFDCFMESNTKGMIIAARCLVSEDGQFFEESDNQASNTEKPYGKITASLFKNGFFNVFDVLSVIGTDEEYREWIRNQPCIVSSEFDYVELNTGGGMEPKNEACHVLRADYAPSRQGANPNKPMFSCVPMQHQYHRLQHDKGESYCYAKHLQFKTKKALDRAPNSEESKEWFEKKKNQLLIKWCKQSLERKFSIESLGDMHPQKLVTWAAAYDIEKYLPKEYREYRD